MGERERSKTDVSTMRRGAAPQQATDPATDAAGGAPAPMEPELRAHIGRQLRAMFDEVLGEPVPDRFGKLLEELERKQARKP